MSNNGDVWDAAKRLSDYLQVLLAVEFEIDTIDRLARARKPDEFFEGLYNALRKRENLESKLQEKLGSCKDEEAVNSGLAILRALNPSHIEILRKAIMEGRVGLKLLANYICSRALAHTRTYSSLRSMFRR